MYNITPYLNQLLASSIAGIELDRSKAFKLRNEMGTGGLTNTWGTSDKDGARSVHAILSRFLETTVQTLRPTDQLSKGESHVRKIEAHQSCSQS